MNESTLSFRVICKVDVHTHSTHRLGRVSSWAKRQDKEIKMRERIREGIKVRIRENNGHNYSSKTDNEGSKDNGGIV